tara:strand:+ start:199 stop:588 length:390 start_codon:yes stop_codon:yes gene_type:complete
VDNTRVDLTEYYRGNSLRKGLGRIKKYIVFFGYRCGYTIIPLTPEEPHKFCGGGIKRDTIYFQYIGFGAVPKHRSKRATLILKVHISLESLPSVTQGALLTINGYIEIWCTPGPSFNSFPMGPFNYPKK